MIFQFRTFGDVQERRGEPVGILSGSHDRKLLHSRDSALMMTFSRNSLPTLLLSSWNRFCTCFSPHGRQEAIRKRRVSGGNQASDPFCKKVLTRAAAAAATTTACWRLSATQCAKLATKQVLRGSNELHGPRATQPLLDAFLLLRGFCRSNHNSLGSGCCRVCPSLPKVLLEAGADFGEKTFGYLFFVPYAGMEVCVGKRWMPENNT